MFGVSSTSATCKILPLRILILQTHGNRQKEYWKPKKQYGCQGFLAIQVYILIMGTNTNIAMELLGLSTEAIVLKQTVDLSYACDWIQHATSSANTGLLPQRQT